MAGKDIYVVAKGRSFCGKKRIYGPGDEVDASAFPNEDAFEAFVAKGYIVKSGAAESGSAGGADDKAAKAARLAELKSAAEGAQKALDEAKAAEKKAKGLDEQADAAAKTKAAEEALAAAKAELAKAQG